MQVLQSLIQQIRLTWRLFRDPRVPIYLKVLPFFGFIYLITPLDLIPDVIFGIGQLDDLGILLAGMKLFEVMTPQYLVEEHRLAIQSGAPMVNKRDENVIDGSKLRVDSEKRKRT